MGKKRNKSSHSLRARASQVIVEKEEEELIKITRPGGAARLPLDEGD